MQAAKNDYILSSFNEGYDFFLEEMGTMCWAYEQAEILLNKLIEQNKVNLNDGIAVIKEIVEKAQKSQEKLQNLFYDSMQIYFSGYKTQIEELQQRVDELTKKIVKEQ
ncbi:MAG: hypothetical protein XD78_1441 [Desulfotomaculum sp. 46_296]|nr:MAG: hypothetical protein XD78_1441 [Desulfotomaculum sp. 46_296]HAU31923.1 hypothetical protein [Desulfotomaculum sp.]